jgi:hypothetical protein
VQTAPANIPLPRMDPRGPAPSVPSAPSVAPPVVTAPVETPPVEVPAEQTAPPPEAGSGAFDLINNLIEQTGM